MRVVMICANDPAGMAIAQARAVNAHTEHSVRVVTTTSVYNHAWDKDIHIPDCTEADIDELRDELARADIFHFHTIVDEHHALGPLVPRDYMAGKTLVHHHHGHPDFRGNPHKYQRKYAELGRENLLVSTPDLLRLLPAATWQPNLVPVHDARYTPLENRVIAPVELVHSPTRKDLKNTDDLLASVQQMKAEGVDFTFTMLDKVPHAECLAVKRRAHIAFDHMQGYFGVSSLETLSMGLPTIAGLDAHNRTCVREYTGVASDNDLPWVLASPTTLTGVLREIIANADARAAIGAASRNFMTERFSDCLAALHLADFWQRSAGAADTTSLGARGGSDGPEQVAVQARSGANATVGTSGRSRELNPVARTASAADTNGCRT